jgi:hypothetical protein
MTWRAMSARPYRVVEVADGGVVAARLGPARGGLCGGEPAIDQGLTLVHFQLNLSTFGTHSWVKLGYVGHKDSSSWVKK